MSPKVDNTLPHPPPPQNGVVKKFSTFAAKTYDFVARFVPVIESRSHGDKIYYYGVDNLLPNNNLRLINDCGVAKRCVRKKARYIQGDGFSDKTVAAMPMNDKQTADGLLRHISSYAAYNEGFALLVKRNVEAKIMQVECLPFECVRKTVDGNFEYNPTLGQPNCDLKKKTVHPPFTPNISKEDYLLRIRSEEFNDKAEIFYVYEQTADNPHYPVPDYNAGIEDIETCSEISKADLECVQNGFVPSGILTTSEIDNVNKGANGLTPLEEFTAELKKFSGQGGRGRYLSDYTHSRNGTVAEQNTTGGRYKLFHIMVSSLEEAPKLDSYDAKSILEASNTKRDIIAREVCRLFGVNPILVGFSDAAVLGNQQALANCVAEFNHYINPTQRMITEAFKVLFPAKDWNISQFNPINFIHDRVWDNLTVDEIRAIAGYEPLTTETVTA